MADTHNWTDNLPCRGGNSSGIYAKWRVRYAAQDLAGLVEESSENRHPVRSDDDIDTDVCNAVHNIDACTQEELEELGLVGPATMRGPFPFVDPITGGDGRVVSSIDEELRSPFIIHPQIDNYVFLDLVLVPSGNVLLPTSRFKSISALGRAVCIPNVLFTAVSTR